MSGGVLARAIARREEEGDMAGAALTEALRYFMRVQIRVAVEAHQNLALDAKADREALIRDLVEALC